MDQPTSADDYLTVVEIADLLKPNQQTIRNWIDRGELAAVRLGARPSGSADPSSMPS